jgi:hypothetical protein
MPKTRRRGSDGDSRLAELISTYVNDLVSAVKQEVRRSVSDEVRHFLTNGKGAGRAARAKAEGGTPRRATRRRVMTCIAPNCGNQSKGPRFHYLCDKHKDAPKKDYEAWRKAKQEKKAA